MHETELRIRALIECWADAVQRHDLQTVIADHATDMVMFDVPAPNELRGIEAYRQSWAPFFEYLKQGGVFVIERLDVTAGDDVAFATALLRCGTRQDLEADPSTRLRLTVGLRREKGHWMIAHEHHSFPRKDA
jgi:uncharacterized protein (TIGR02246 family)